MGFFKKLRDGINKFLMILRTKKPSDKHTNLDSDVGIEFECQLFDGALVFKIVDDDFEFLGGYVIVSPGGIPKIFINDFEDCKDEINDEVCRYLKEKAMTFYLDTK